jgi:hypothetical protein
MLMNLSGHLGAWIEGDLMQEHYNRWLEDMVTKRGGDFDDEFYRTYNLTQCQPLPSHQRDSH